MPLTGIHWRNVRELDESAFEIASGFQSVIVLSSSGPQLPIEIHRRWPEKQIITRLYWPAGDLPYKADAFDDWHKYLMAVRGAVNLAQILNEPDEEYKGDTPEFFSTWFSEMVSLLRRYFGGMQFGFPMPSIQGEASWDYAVRCEAGIQAADWLAERGYWTEPWQMDDMYWGSRYFLTHERWPNKLIHICEYGNANKDSDPNEKPLEYARFVRELPEYVGSAHAFIMENPGISDDPEQNKWVRFWINKEWAKIMLGQVVGQPVPGNPPESAPGEPTNGGTMSDYIKVRIFYEWKAARDSAPAFEKCAAENLDLGGPIGAERDTASIRWQPYYGGIILAPIGKWELTQAIIDPAGPDSLPNFP